MSLQTNIAAGFARLVQAVNAVKSQLAMIEVRQADVGTAPGQIPLNQHLGTMAYMSGNALVINPVATAVPAGVGDMVFQLSNDTTLVIKVKGTDGTVRTATLTLA